MVLLLICLFADIPQCHGAHFWLPKSDSFLSSTSIFLLLWLNPVLVTWEEWKRSTEKCRCSKQSSGGPSLPGPLDWLAGILATFNQGIIHDQYSINSILETGGKWAPSDFPPFLDYRYEPGEKRNWAESLGMMKRERRALEGNEKMNKTESEAKMPLRVINILLRRLHHVSQHFSLLQILSQGCNIHFENMLHSPPKSINIDFTFEQARVSTQVEPNDFETTQRVHDAEAH